MGYYIGIDVGATHTDGVAVAVSTGSVAAKVKVETSLDLYACSMEALEGILEKVPTKEVKRVLFSTTLVTNAVATGTLEPPGLILMAGPGMNPSFLTDTPDCHLISGAMDHRGREIVPVDKSEIARVVDNFLLKGIAVVAVAGKFSGRNPSHELAVKEIAADRFDYLSLSHNLSGALNFPRRAITAYLSAALWRRHSNFISAITRAVRGHGVEAPLYLLQADGGAALAESLENGAETALSGPAASIMGADAMRSFEGELLTLDIGGTTTDIAMLIDGVPLLEQHGATISGYKTQIRSLYNRSIPVGGDSEVKVDDGVLTVGPKRRGKAAALGGPLPTPTDALIILGRYAKGDADRARKAFEPIAKELSLTIEEASERVLSKLAETIARETENFVNEVNSRPVYTIRELLHGHKVAPTHALLVGGPARLFVPYVEEALGIPVEVPRHSDVANAIGAAVSRVSLEVNATADTSKGDLSIPEAGVYRKVKSNYSMGNLEKETLKELETLARSHGVTMRGYQPEVLESESFNIIEGYARTGSFHRIRAQVRPSLRCNIKESG